MAARNLNGSAGVNFVETSPRGISEPLGVVKEAPMPICCWVFDGCWRQIHLW
jgi:hypothetical protein